MDTTQTMFDYSYLTEDYFSGGRNIVHTNRAKSLEEILAELQERLTGKAYGFTLADTAAEVITLEQSGKLPTFTLCVKVGLVWVNYASINDILNPITVEFNATFTTMTVTNDSGGALDFELFVQ